MNIVIAASTPGHSGAVIYARRIVALLAARGHRIWVAASPHSWIAGETANEATLLATDFRRWPLDECARIAAFCKQEQIDVFHSHLTRSCNFGALLQVLHGVPSVAHLHSNSLRAHAWFHRLLIAVSHNTLRQHQRRGAAWGGRGVVLWNFVDPTVFQPASGPDRLRPLLGVASDVPVLLVAGKLCRQKGQSLATRALQIVRKVHPTTVLALAGPGTLPRGIRLEGTHLLGNRYDFPELLPHASLVLVPSTNESFSLTALEAMACKVPVIATQCGGVSEVLAGGGGILVPKSDARAMAAAVIQLLDDPAECRRQGGAGLSRTQDLFLPSGHIEKLEQLYARAAQHRG